MGLWLFIRKKCLYLHIISNRHAMELRQYPVGIQTFEEIRKRNLLYIDKTEYIYRMTHGGGK